MRFCLLVLAAVSSISAQCSFERGSIAAKWSVNNDEVTIEFTNKNLGNNQWTAVAFGKSMSNLDVVVFKVDNFKISMKTGVTDDYGPPVISSKNTVSPVQLKYNSNRLDATFTRPLAANGGNSVSLEGCQPWAFIGSNDANEGGSIGFHNNPPVQIDVCLDKCASRAAGIRNLDTDPLPLAALLNNRESQRWDDLRQNS